MLTDLVPVLRSVSSIKGYGEGLQEIVEKFKERPTTLHQSSLDMFGTIVSETKMVDVKLGLIQLK